MGRECTLRKSLEESAQTAETACEAPPITTAQRVASCGGCERKRGQREEAVSPAKVRA